MSSHQISRTPPLAIAFAKVASKITLKLWLRADTIADDITDAAFDLFRQTADDVFEAKVLSANWERITKNISDMIASTPEFRTLNFPDKAAACFDIAGILASSRLDASFFAEVDYDERRLRNFLETQLTLRLAGGQSAEHAQTIITLLIPYTFNMSTLLPDFQLRANQRILAKQDQLLVVVNQILDLVSGRYTISAQMPSHLTTTEVEHILRYRNMVRNKFAKINIVGA
jgi:hypothetical protein